MTITARRPRSPSLALTRDQHSELRRRCLAREPQEVTAAWLGCTVDQLRKYIQRHGLPRRLRNSRGA